MELKDLCVICQVNMIRGDVKKIIPCNHLFHAKCVENFTEDAICPLCRGQISSMTSVVRKMYRKYTEQDKTRVIEAASKGLDWTELASSLGISYKTAYSWLYSANNEPTQRGGKKPRLLTEDQLNVVLSWVERKPSITLKEIKQRCWTEFNKWISESTIGNGLHGKLYTIKSLHTQPEGMNSIVNKEKRAEYVRKHNDLLRNHKQFIYVDQTNFNLYCRRKQGWARAGARAVQVTPSSRGPNIHLIGAIGNVGTIKMDKRRGSFRALDANEWMLTVFAQWEAMGNTLSELVVVCDNAPCHSRLELIFDDCPATLLRLAPYSPQLNPIETIWSKVKTYVKGQMEVPRVTPPNVGDQRLQYLEDLVERAKETITVGDCSRAILHSTTFHEIALSMEDMPVGT